MNGASISHLNDSGFVELTHTELVEVNGGGVWSIVKAFFASEVTWTAFIATIVWDILMNPEEVWNQICEGFTEWAYEE